MTPHYFALHSRLGLQHAPVGSTELNIGVEDGPDAILNRDFLTVHPGKVTPYHFPEPTESSDYWEMMRTHTQQAARHINESLQPDQAQVVIGGDHSVTFASLLALSQRMNLNDVGYIQIDSHPDLNTLAASPTGNFHGMYVRAAVGTIGVPTIDTCITNKLPPQNIWYFGNLSFDPDPEEKNFLAQYEIPATSVQRLRTHKKDIKMQLLSFLRKFKHIHTSFDIDSMDATIAPATGIPCTRGFLLEDIKPVLATICSNANSLSFDLVEVNPRKDGADKTITTAQEILAVILE